MSNVTFYHVSSDYLGYLRSYDSKVSLKDTRPVVCVGIKLNHKDYYIPLTSKLEKKTNSQVTISIKDGDKTISKMLINNMIPIPIDELTRIDIPNSVNKDFLQKEYEFIKKNKDEIVTKAIKVYNKRISNNIQFFNNICCDFKKLEDYCSEYYN